MKGAKKLSKIAIVGGGLAGLVNAILLSRKGFEVSLFEKKQYPFHKVCGEYISNEVLPFLKREKLLPPGVEFSTIKKFQFSSVKGKDLFMPLDLGGFGLSRYTLDHFLVQKARAYGAKIFEGTTVAEVSFEDQIFNLTTTEGNNHLVDLVIGAYGKNGILDKKLKRDHLKGTAPFVGVKYHVKTDFPKDLVALHNFEGGYCGISAIENDSYNLCYLGRRAHLKSAGSVEAMEEQTLKKNPFLKSIFENSDFLFEKPVVINAFSFRPKQLIENHILMSGDTAGLITPLCGNGMAMAIHSAKILSDAIIRNHQNGELNRTQLEADYTAHWNATFKRRLWVGRNTQSLFGTKISSEIALLMMKNSPWIANKIMKNTHGQPF
ncbi:MAG: flavin-dependent dehydrogenase [Roseivirga sp.]|jgi:flavin-dependent dehydrogenase